MMRKFWILGAVLVLGLGANGGGCSNPNGSGVTQFGTIVGRVLDATTNRPVAGVLVSVGSLYTTYSDSQGAFTLVNIPAGNQDVSANSPGFTVGTVRAKVRENQAANVGYLRIVPLIGGPTLPPPPTPTPTPGIETPTPALTPR